MTRVTPTTGIEDDDFASYLEQGEIKELDWHQVMADQLPGVAFRRHVLFFVKLLSEDELERIRGNLSEVFATYSDQEIALSVL